MNDFLQDDYKVPSKADGYMKLQQGDNRLRIMGRPIIGYEYWLDTPEGGRKPVRIRMNEKVPMDIPEPEKVKHFWAMVVWDYEGKQFKILELTQKGIQKTITGLSRDKDWGTPLNYDLVINKTGEKMETEYQVVPKPAKGLDETILKAYKALEINLEALYEGKDPFTSNESVEASGLLDEDILPEEVKV